METIYGLREKLVKLRNSFRSSERGIREYYRHYR